MAGANAAAPSEKPYINLSESTNQVIKVHGERINEYIESKRDFSHDYFSISTLKRSYLIRDTNGIIIETPQYMWMRVAIGIHENDIEAALETYDLLSTGYFTFATPTLFNSGTISPQMSSCFLLANKNDSIKGIFETVSRAESIKVRAFDKCGIQFEMEADGLLAVCIQHEIEHLEGKLFVDMLSNFKQKRIIKKLSKLNV